MLIVAAKLGDGAGDDGTHAQNTADFGGSCSIDAVAIGEILFFEDLIHGVAVDHPIFGVLNKLLFQEQRNAFTYILVGAKVRLHRRTNRAIIEIQNCHELLVLCPRT